MLRTFRRAPRGSVRILFDESRLVSDAGLLLTATLAGGLGIEELVNESAWLGGSGAGRGVAGSKVMSLVHGCSPPPTASMR
jgi:hypothetical protein